MIMKYKTYEVVEQNHKIGIVGLPSGEYLELNSEEFISINNAHMLEYKTNLKTFVFDDRDYDNIMYYIKNSQIYKIRSFLHKIGIKKYKINDDYTIDVWENVIIREKLEHIPIKFDYVDGDFDCSKCGLISLMGCPEDVSGDFNASNNNLPDLLYGPSVVSGNYDVSHNKLMSLKGAPTKIYGNFDCSYNSLRRLQHSPVMVSGSFDCSSCMIESLDGSPDDIGVDFNCSFNYLTTLKNGPDMINGTYDCSFNELETLKEGPDSVGVFKCNNNKIKDLSHAPIDCKEVISDGQKYQ
jgi:hypothetical protein